MKKLLKVLSLALIATLIFALASCVINDKPEPDPIPDPIDPAPNPQDPNAMVKEGVADNNFMSRSVVSYPNINNSDVTVDLFYRFDGEARNNPNVGVGIMLYQCIQYKKAHPDKEVEISFTSFHLSVVAAVCLKRDSADFGRMKSVYDSEYTQDGYVRISYLLVYAAKIGIKTVVIGQIDASPVIIGGGYRADYDFNKYFTGHLSDECEIEGKRVGDFMTFRKAYWTSYGDKSASDMMHNKTCTVSNYIDMNGVEHGAATWFGSTNLDGISESGANGNDGIQTGVIVSDHEVIRKVTYNYTELMSQYCEQEEIMEFRNAVAAMNKTQVDLILAGRSDEIPSNEQIVYLGSLTDRVFELYFTPFGGAVGKWDVKYNVFSKYINKLLPATAGDDYIVFAWNNVKYLTNFEYSKTLTNILVTAFTQNANTQSKLYLHLPGIDYSVFNNLTEGQNIGKKVVGQHKNNHAKDLQLSFAEDGERQYVTMFSSLNFHQGSMWYQTNTVLVVKETAETKNDLYVKFGYQNTWGVIDESDRLA